MIYIKKDNEDITVAVDGNLATITADIAFCCKKIRAGIAEKNPQDAIIFQTL